MSEVKVASVQEAPHLVATIVLAFASDPMVRWTFPPPGTYLRVMPDLVRAFGGRAFEHDTAYYLNDAAAAALWLPPGVQPDEETMATLMQQAAPERVEEAFSVMEQMDHYHPKTPHWYLPLTGVDPMQQGKGYGAQLLEAALERCDEAQLSAYLESSNPRNIPLYERHGFQALGRIQAGTSPVMVPMLREPQPL